MVVVGREGPIGRRHHLHLRHADDVSRSTRCRPNTDCWPNRSAIRTISPAVTYRLRAEAKWHDGQPVTPEDVIFSLEAFKKHHPQYVAYYRHVTKAEKTGDREITFTFDQAGQSRIAADRRPDQRAAEALVGRQGRAGPPARHFADHARSAARLRRLSRSRPSCRAAASSTSASPDYWGNAVNVNVGTNNFDELRLRIFPRHHGRARSLQGRPARLAQRISAKDWATAYDFPAVTREARGARGIRDPQFRRHAGLRLQHAARQVQGSARAPRLQLRVRLRGNEQADFLRAIQAHRQLSSRAPSLPRPGCRRGSSSKSCKR